MTCPARAQAAFRLAATSCSSRATHRSTSPARVNRRRSGSAGLARITPSKRRLISQCIDTHHLEKNKKNPIRRARPRQLCASKRRCGHARDPRSRRLLPNRSRATHHSIDSLEKRVLRHSSWQFVPNRRSPVCHRRQVRLRTRRKVTCRGKSSQTMSVALG